MAIWCAAASVPLLLLAIFYVAFQLREINLASETRTVNRAEAYIAQLDASLAEDLGALAVLAGSQSIRSSDIQEGRNRAIAAMADFPRWKNVILTDATSREEVWQTAGPDAKTPARRSLLAFANRKTVAEVGGIGENHECVCVPLHRHIANSDLILTVERDITEFQEILKSESGAEETAALVDREGLFIARTKEQNTRFGTPATQYVRKAVAQGGSGVYSGITYEGMSNRTAYVTSPISKWSVHFAIPALAYDLLMTGQLAISILGLAVALSFAIALTLYGIRDIRRRAKEERARVQSYKLEAIGTLSSAVAHDFNNLLTIMSACLRILEKSDDPKKQHQAIQEGKSAAERSAKLVQQLLTFARDKPIELSCVDLTATIDGIRDLLARSLGSNITLKVDVAPDARYAQTNAAPLELVLINLAVNAKDAMPEGGTLSIFTKKATTAGCVDLMVKDTGIGMSEEVAAQALEPFFTTKPEGKGTGLGLAQAHLLAKDSKGSLYLDTALGKGTTFTFCLPACEP
jgi:signal transduction histidine kinase